LSSADGRIDEAHVNEVNVKRANTSGRCDDGQPLFFIG
jgi:hypothetical protein